MPQANGTIKTDPPACAVSVVLIAHLDVADELAPQRTGALV
jgi:hypothetical protein